MSCVKRACSDRLLLPLCLHLPFVLIHFRIRGSLGIVDAVMLIGSAERVSVCKTQRNPPVFFGIVGIRLLFQTAHDIPIRTGGTESAVHFHHYIAFFLH